VFSLGTSVSSTYKTDSHDIAVILLKVALNTITLTHLISQFFQKNISELMTEKSELEEQRIRADTLEQQVKVILFL
jgi:hypothetical protein